MHHEKEKPVDDFTDDIKKIEEEAEKLTSEALLEKEKFLLQARDDAAQGYSKKEKKIESDYEAKLKKEKERIDQASKERLMDADKEMQRLEKETRKRIQKAAAIIASRITGD